MVFYNFIVGLLSLTLIAFVLHVIVGIAVFLHYLPLPVIHTGPVVGVILTVFFGWLVTHFIEWLKTKGDCNETY